MTVHTLDLLKHELRQTLQQPVTWIVLGLLFISMIFASLNGVSRVERQNSDFEAAKVMETKAHTAARQAHVTFKTNSDVKIDYHRDPTDAFGYWGWFMVKHGVKPQLPLSEIAAGQADLTPSLIRVDFNSIFPDATIELKNAQSIRLGPFDLNFVLLTLVPLAILSLSAGKLTAERENGVLAMMSVQAASLQQIALSKFGALAIIAGFGIAILFIGSVLLTQISGPSFALAQLGLIVGLWVTFWVALAAFVTSFWRSTVTTLIGLFLTWVTFAFVLPTIIGLGINIVSQAPSRFVAIDLSRAAMDAYYGNDKVINMAWYRQNAQASGGNDELAKSPEVKRFSRDAFYREKLIAVTNQRSSYATRTQSLSDGLRFVSPSLMIDALMTEAAGNDANRHFRFVKSVDDYAQELRAFFIPISLSNAANPSVSCITCRGRLNFDNYDAIPVFDQNALQSQNSRWFWPTLVYFLVLSGLLAILALRRFRTWP